MVFMASLLYGKYSNESIEISGTKSKNAVPFASAEYGTAFFRLKNLTPISRLLSEVSRL